MKKDIFIIPGFKEKISDKAYVSLKNLFIKKGFTVHLVPIVWNYKTISDQITQFEEFYKKKKSKNNYILGFSFGAVIAFAAANKLKPKKLFLCSLSPYFKEDLKLIPNTWKKFVGKKRILDFSKLIFGKLAKEINIKTKTLVFIGEEESKKYITLKKRCEDAKSKIKNSKLIVIKNAPHDIGNKYYLEALDENIS